MLNYYDNRVIQYNLLCQFVRIYESLKQIQSNQLFNINYLPSQSIEAINIQRMFRKLINRISLAMGRKKSGDAPIDVLLKQFHHKCLQFREQNDAASNSSYFTAHVPLILESPSMNSVLYDKINKIQQEIKKCNDVFQLCLGKVLLQIIEEEGLFHMFVKLWMGSFCAFEIKKIISHYQQLNKQANLLKKSTVQTNIQSSESSLKDLQQNLFKQQKNLNMSTMAKSRKPRSILSNPQIQEQKIEKIKQFFHRQFFLLVYFIYQLAMFFYQENLEKCTFFQPHQLFRMIRSTITSLRCCSQIHELFRININCKKMDFTEQQIQQNMAQLQKICKISKIPAAFMESQNILNQFIKCPQLDSKVRKSSALINKLKQQILQYRKINEMPQNFIFCADDVLTALTYIMWRLRKNLYGPCVYIELILCCQYQAIHQDRLAEQLDKFGDNIRHSFDTLRSVAKIGLLESDKIYSLA